MSLNGWSYDDELPKSTGSRRKGDDWGESYILFLEWVCFKVNGDSGGLNVFRDSSIVVD